MEDTNEDRKGYASGVAITAVTFLALVYFLCPVLFALPVVLIYGKHGAPPPQVQTALGIAFYPVNFLYERVPPYRWLLTKEQELLGLD